MAMQKCPVCEGRQTMPETFYTRSTFMSRAPEYVTCRTCRGSGMVRTYPAYEMDPDASPTPFQLKPYEIDHVSINFPHDPTVHGIN